MPQKKAMAPAIMIKKYFAPDKTAKEFMVEYRDLTPEDRKELSEAIAKEWGIEIKQKETK